MPSHAPSQDDIAACAGDAGRARLGAVACAVLLLLGCSPPRSATSISNIHPLAAAAALARSAIPPLAGGGAISSGGLLAATTLASQLGVSHAQATPPGTMLFDVAEPLSPECDDDANALLSRLRGMSAECNGSGCSGACGVAVVPFLEKCGKTVDLLLSPDAAASLQSKRDTCLAGMTAGGLLVQLRERVNQGVCPEIALEGVAVTAVPDAVCVDTRANCAAGIAAGFMGCDADFCITCHNAGECDQSCGICGGGGAGAGGEHRRALQSGGDTCPPDFFSADVQSVTRACCDDATGGCAAGVPAECDARCGIIYTDFFERCGSLLRVANPTDYQAYTRLYQTCSQDLPVAPLFSVLAGRCAVGSQPQCAAQPCLNGGVCTDSRNTYTCSCAPGYGGPTCATDIDECASAPCANGGECTEAVDSYVCVCAAGWEGEGCATATAPAGFAVFAVGNNRQGQLGDGTTTERHTPVAVNIPGDAVAICAGGGFAGVITLGGVVFMFGENYHGQLGDGTSIERHTPVEITALGADNAQLAAGVYHTVVRKVGGGIWSWGRNYRGEIGDGRMELGAGRSTSAKRQSPYHIASLGDDNVFVAAQTYGNIVMKSSGQVFGWGWNDAHQITADEDNGFTDYASLYPEAHYSILTPVAIAAAGTDNVALATGGNHALLLKADGSLVSWGRNSEGQLGNGELYTASRHDDGDACCVMVDLPLAVMQIDAAESSSYALLADGSVYAWGLHADGELTSLPLNPNYQLGGGGYDVSTFVALLPNGSAVGSGNNDHGQLATGNTADVLIAGPLPGLGVDNVATARGGGGFMLLLRRP